MSEPERYPVGAFQIDDFAIVAIRTPEGELFWSGLVPCRPEGEGFMLSIGGEELRCHVSEKNTDPEVVGAPATKGQRRMRWEGYALFDD